MKVDQASKSTISLAIDSAAMWLQFTSQNWFTKSLSGGYKMTNRSRVQVILQEWKEKQSKKV